MIQVIHAEYLKDYSVYIEFSDGRKGAVNLSDLLWGPVFEPLKDLEMFRDFTISPILDTICWKNGADIAPEYLYERLEA